MVRIKHRSETRVQGLHLSLSLSASPANFFSRPRVPGRPRTLFSHRACAFRLRVSRTSLGQAQGILACFRVFYISFSRVSPPLAHTRSPDASETWRSPPLRSAVWQTHCLSHTASPFSRRGLAARCRRARMSPVSLSRRATRQRTPKSRIAMAASSATAASQVSEPPKLPAEEVGAADGDAAAAPASQACPECAASRRAISRACSHPEV